MNLTDELSKLAELHRQGSLSDEEFANAKQSLIAENRADPAASTAGSRTAALPTAAVEERTYQSSRWSAGNLFFPDRLTLAGDGMLFHKRRMFGSNQEHINYRAVASLRVKNGIFLSNLTIETSGGTQPIFINGLWKSDARAIQETLRVAQGG